jgi:deazaflavin-dependent oxidoreductase (nitroreductase family)
VAARQRSLTSAAREIGVELAEWGKVALVETTGRVSGRPVTTAVGFVDGADGEILVAAGSEASDWALNLRAQPSCRVTIGDQAAEFEATEIAEGPQRARVLVDLVLKYGTPAERLGRGPVFRLVPRT